MTPAESPLVLAANGVLAADIILPHGAGATEEFAADELRRHLCQMLGVPALHSHYPSGPRPRIYINDPDAATAAGLATEKLAPEAFRLRTTGDALHILGGSPRGALYGVYELLEALGCRWFAPSVTHIPRRRRIALGPLDTTGKPDFEFRDMFNFECGDPLWWVRNRLNGNYVAVPGYMGGNVSYGLFVHTFYALVPPGEFFASHPEYFSLLNGVRRHEQGQLCLTNPEVLRIVTQRVIEHMRKNPKATIFSVSQNDWDGYCECPQCAAVAREEGSQAGPVIRFVNRIAEETSKIFPDKLIDTLAYMYTLDACRTAPHRNVRVRLCPIKCCQGHEFGTCDHPESRRFLKALEGWGRLTPQMYIWHYCTNFSHYVLPMPDLDELHANINLYRRHGVYGIFTQGMGQQGGGAESLALRGYVVSKLLWNADQPVWPHVDAFLGAFYGKAAGAVRQYLDLFHDRVRADRKLHPSLGDPPTHPLFDEATLSRAATTLESGMRQAGGEPRRRVRMLLHGVNYARLYRAGGVFRRTGDVYHGDAGEGEVAAFDAMMRDWKAAGMQHIEEGATLDYSRDKVRSRLASHPVLWLRDGGHEIAVVPELGGRLLEWNAFGQQWLSPADPNSPFFIYPNDSGYVEFASLSTYVYSGWASVFRARRRGAALLLTARLSQQLEFSRTLTLKDGVLVIRSRLANVGRDARSATWGASLQLRPPAPPVVRFTTAEGEQLIRADQMPDGLHQAQILEGPRLPQGSWRLEMPGYVLTHGFEGPIVRAILGQVAARGMLALDLRTDYVKLAPGAMIEATQRVKIEKM